MSPKPLRPDQLRRECAPAELEFDTTDALDPLLERPGQARAFDAIAFAVDMRHDGYNLFVMGPTGVGKHAAVRALLARRAANDPVPADAVYVQDFAAPRKPRALRLPPGRGSALRRDVAALLEELRSVVPRALESSEFRAKKEALDEEHKKRHDAATEELAKRAEAKRVAIAQTPLGVTIVPLDRSGEVIPPDVFAKLPDEERRGYERDIEGMGKALRQHLDEVPRWEAEVRARTRALVRETLAAAIKHLFFDVKKPWAELPDVLAYLEALERDVVENAGRLLRGEDGAAPAGSDDEVPVDSPLRRYRVNVLVDNGDAKGAPVVHEDHPSYDNLFGSIEHVAQLGALFTDFTLIKAGALHRANGGYLVLDARELLLSPFAWDGLKRALRARQIRIETLGQRLGLVTTESLEPAPIALDVKVVLVGDRALFHLLGELDPDVPALFKVAADFEDDLPRTPEATRLYARLVAATLKEHGLLPFDRGAVGRVVEHCARAAEDAHRLSANMGMLLDLLCEADQRARRRGASAASAEDVDRALEAQRTRAGRVRERLLEETVNGTLLVQTSGQEIGQVNGLSVVAFGRHAFGRPARITARVRLGKGEVVDIEREVELGGPLHSKGVLILSGYLGARYAADRPLSLSASIVFEQSYGAVEGDSASCAELLALLSALARTPLAQSIAVTGSVNQRGDVQAIGGANDKVEGFFDLCAARGLTGDQGVILPEANVRNLMLRRDVVEAARAGRFHVWAVRRVEEAIELSTGLSAETVDRRVEERLRALATARDAREHSVFDGDGAVRRAALSS